MTNEEMDRRIAEYFGADCMAGSRFATWPMQAGEMLRKITVHVAQSDERDGRLFAQIPNFSTDLNAMHEAEKTLSQHQYWEYADLRLKETVWRYGWTGKAYQCATATHRAEAFLRTIGKYSDATHQLP